jgi:hypothetical protein
MDRTEPNGRWLLRYLNLNLLPVSLYSSQRGHCSDHGSAQDLFHKLVQVYLFIVNQELSFQTASPQR